MCVRVKHRDKGQQDSLVGDLGADLLAGGLLEETAACVGDLLGRLAGDGVAGLLGAKVESWCALLAIWMMTGERKREFTLVNVVLLLGAALNVLLGVVGIHCV